MHVNYLKKEVTFVFLITSYLDIGKEIIFQISEPIREITFKLIDKVPISEPIRKNTLKLLDKLRKLFLVHFLNRNIIKL